MASFRLPYWSAWPIHSTPHVSRFFCCLPCCPRLLSRCLSLLREPGTTALRCLDLALPPSSALSTFLPLVHTLVRPAATLPIAACASVNMVTFSGGIISKIRLYTVCNRLAAWRVTLCGAADERSCCSTAASVLPSYPLPIRLPATPSAAPPATGLDTFARPRRDNYIPTSRAHDRRRI